MTMKNKSELIGSAVVASFQLLRYVRRHEYIEIQMLHGVLINTHLPKNGQRQQQDEVLPSVCLAFSPVTNDVVVNLLRRKLEKLCGNVFGWKNTCGNVSQKIRLTFEEVFANYALLIVMTVYPKLHEPRKKLQ